MNDAGAWVAFLMLLILCFILYFLPAIIATRRNHPNATAITVLSIFLGWTLVGWVAALVWALTVSPVAPKVTEADGARRPCPTCGESISIQARLCRFCNHPLPA
jgi:RsiW-degrading membrane proteinase PrsW (M82 family)